MASAESNVMIRRGDLFSSDAQTLVNTVNTVGVMGKGLAAQFKSRFPAMFREYAALCERGAVELGRPYLWVPLWPPWVLNFPTKGHWRADSKLQDIVTGLDHLVEKHLEWGITSLAVPPLGCGEGGLEWRVVGPVLHQRLAELTVPVELFVPASTPASQTTIEFLSGSAPRGNVARLSAGAIALADLVDRLRHLGPPVLVGPTAFRRLAYFATAAGIPTGLSFSMRSVGPSASLLLDLRRRLENNGVLVPSRTDRGTRFEAGLAHRDAVAAFRDDLKVWGSTLSRLVDLCSRGALERDVVAAVHYAIVQLGAEPTIEGVARALDVAGASEPLVRHDAVNAALSLLEESGWIGEVKQAQAAGP